MPTWSTPANLWAKSGLSSRAYFRNGTSPTWPVIQLPFRGFHQLVGFFLKTVVPRLLSLLRTCCFPSLVKARSSLRLKKMNDPFPCLLFWIVFPRDRSPFPFLVYVLDTEALHVSAAKCTSIFPFWLLVFVLCVERLPSWKIIKRFLCFSWFSRGFILCASFFLHLELFWG